MIEWFDDLALGMRFKSGEFSVTKRDILAVCCGVRSTTVPFR